MGARLTLHVHRPHNPRPGKHVAAIVVAKNAADVCEARLHGGPSELESRCGFLQYRPARALTPEACDRSGRLASP